MRQCTSLRKKAAKTLVTAVAAIAGLSGSISDAQIWDGGGADDNWNNPVNWAGDTVPLVGFSADVTIGAPAPTLLDINAQLNSLFVDPDGELVVTSGRNLDFSGGTAATPLTNLGAITASNNTDLQLQLMVNNSGTINVESLGNLSDLEVTSAGATIDGGGTITLGGDFNARIMGLSNPLLTIADQTIEGWGQIGANSISIDNQGNLIDANSSSNELQIDPNANGMINTGILQASAGGILSFSTGTVDNTGGTIRALAGSEVQFLSSAAPEIVGGTLTTAGDGILRVAAGSNTFFEEVTNNGNMISDNNTDFGITGTFTNNGNVSIESTGNLTDIEIQAAGATIDGGGTITLGGNFNARIVGVGNPNPLLTISDQTIEGWGQIGVNTISIDNQGSLIDANSGGNELRIDPNGDGMVNTGILQASGGGILSFSTGTIDNAGGTIRALADSEVHFLGSTAPEIIGGTLTTAGDGILRVAAGSNTFFEDVTNNGNMISNNNTDFGITGTFTNNGNISIESTGNLTDIEIQADGATLDGGGTITLGGNFNARIMGLSNTLLTIADQTIEGWGQIGVNSISIDNQGNLIDANSSSNELRIDPDANGMINTGILQASAGGILSFTTGTIDNTGGTIRALAGSEVQFLSSAAPEIVGGTLTTAGDGVLRVAAGSNTFFEDVINNGNMISDNNTDFGITGTFTNNGNISVESTGNLTDIEIQASGAVLTGIGTTSLIAFNSRIDGPGDFEMNNGRLEGVGQIFVNSTFRQLATVAPGNSIGELTFSGNHVTQFVDGATLEIEVGALTGTEGVDWDFLDVNGTLDFDDDVLPSGATVKLVSLDTNGDPGMLAGFNQGVDNSWLIADCTVIEGFSSSFVTVDSTDFANDFCGIFTVTQTGNQLFLNYLSQVVEVSPDDVTTIRGVVVSGDMTDVIQSDDLVLQYNPGFTLNANEPPVWVEFEGTVAAGAPQWLNLKLESRVNTPGIVQQIEMFNWTTGSFEIVDARGTSFNIDRTDNIALPVPDIYVQPGTNLVRARTGWRRDGFTILFPWTVSIDYVVWLLQ